MPIEQRPYSRKLVGDILAEIHGPTLRQELAMKGIRSSASPLRGPAEIKRKRALMPLKLVSR